MTLEDQIRRMGEARATEVDTPSWHGHVGTSRQIPWRWVGAAAAFLVMVLGVVAALSGGDNSDDTFAGEPSTDGHAIRRWVPAGDISMVVYSDLSQRSFTPGNEIALVTTPDDAGSPDDDDWTQIRRGAAYLGLQGDEGPQALPQRDDVAIVWLPDQHRGDSHGLMLVSRRFDSDTLLALSPSLEGAADLRSAAAIVAEWADDVEVVYEGPPAEPDVFVSASTREQKEPPILWLNTTSELQYAASYPALADGRGFELFARDDESADPSAFVWSEDPSPREVDDAKWNEVHRTLADQVDEVLLRVSMVSVRDAENPNADADSLGKIVARATPQGTSFSLELVFEQPVDFALGDSVNIFMSPFFFFFRDFGPAETTDRLVLDARMSEWEAERLALLINEGLEPDPVGASQTGICAAHREPIGDVLDVATHIAPDRTPLDLDQDGVDDELLIYDDEDGNWWLLARLQTGWTNAVDLGTPMLPRLALTPDGVAAASDLDGDGQLEFFVAGYIERSAALVTLRGCQLIDSFSVEHPVSAFGAAAAVQIGPPVDSAICQGRSCATRVRCVDNVLVQELFIGVAANDAAGEWVTTEIRLEQTGTITTLELPPQAVEPFDALDDPPTEATTDVIDCRP